jgi:glutaredoxin
MHTLPLTTATLPVIHCVSVKQLPKEDRTMKTLSRPQRWINACSDCIAALDTLEEIRSEYEEWRDSLPENLEGSATSEKLDVVADEADVQSAIDIIEELAQIDLPRGFGRD